MRCYGNSPSKGFDWISPTVVTLAVLLCCASVHAQTVRPIRHSLPNVASVYGSSSNGGCTSLENNMICSLQDGGTSVLVDGTILPLSGLDGNQWARDLFTVNKTGQSYSVIGFDFGDLVDVRRLELVYFNCPQFQTAFRAITVYGTSSAVDFPLTRDRIASGTEPSPVVNAGSINLNSVDDSCDNLLRVCIPISHQTQVYYVEFFGVGSSWVVLAEATFYTGSTPCSTTPMPVTSPITPEPPPMSTSTGGASTTSVDTMSTVSPNSSTNRLPEPARSDPTIAIVVAVIVIILLLVIAVVAVILVVMLLMIRNRKRNQQLSEVQKFQNAMLEKPDLDGKQQNSKDYYSNPHYDVVDSKNHEAVDSEPQGALYEDVDSQVKGRRPDVDDSTLYNKLRDDKAKTLPVNTNGRLDDYSSLQQDESSTAIYSDVGPKEQPMYAVPDVKQEEYSEIQKPAIPEKSSELVEYLETKEVVPSQLPEYSEIRESANHDVKQAQNPKLASLTRPIFSAMEENPMYSEPSLVPQPMPDNIYAEPDAQDQITSSMPEGSHEYQDIYETVYSEPLKPTLFTQGGSTGTTETEIFPYSSIYTAPDVVLPDEKPPVLTSKNIKEIKELGRGNFGQVVLAETVGLSRRELRLSRTEDGNPGDVTLLVAIKKLKPSASSKTRELFEKETKFMSRLNHPNVIRLLGICTTETPFIMMEYMEKGDLNQYLRQFGSVSDDGYQNTNTISTTVLVHMATQIASAMGYLASQNFVHRDLATRNCLVGNNNLVKIADFGMSRSLYDSHYYIIQGKAILPIRWMATECFYGKFSAKTDVWAFGVTMWEIFTLGKTEPYGNKPDREVVEDAVKGEKRTLLEQPSDCPGEVYEIMKKCWLYDPAKRATFEELHSLLSAINQN